MATPAAREHTLNAGSGASEMVGCAAELCATIEQLRAIVEHAPEAIGVFECDRGRFVLCNENTRKLLGLTREQLLRTDVLAISAEFQGDGQPSSKVARERIAQALAGETPTFEWLFRHAQGHVIPCEVRLVRLPGDSQRLIRGSMIDMRERKRREKTQHATYEISEAVHEAEDLDRLYARIHSIVRTLMPADNFYIVLHDLVAGHHFYAYHVDLVDPHPAARVMKDGLNGYVLRTGNSLLTNRVSMTDPASPWRLQSGTPSAVWLGVPLEVRGETFGLIAVQDYKNEWAYGEEEKQILTYVGKQIALAIDRKRSEQALRQSEETLRQRHREVSTLLESLPGYAFFKDAYGHYVMANQNFARAVGHTSESILGKTDTELFPLELATKYRADDARLLKSGTPLAVGEEMMIEGGRTFTVQTTKVPVKNDRGDVVGLIGLGFDVTDRKNAESELLKALAREKELGELKSSFVSMVSHEFRTPLGIIMSSAEILQDYLDQLPADERNAHLKSIQKNTRRMAELMEEVLLLGRFDAGKMEFQPKALDLRAFCQRLVDEALSAAECRNPIELDCPAFSGEARGDERLLRHVFLNVITNALKYSECGQPIRLAIQRDGRDAVCRIGDKGIGIPESDREWLFNAFHRGRNVGQRPGSGLGLVIVKRCLDLHGGRIQIDSKVGEGTTVTLRIPLFTAEL